MPASPSISVVTPSFNQAAFLEETIQSVLQQNCQNLEYVIIDGGSSDGSADIIRRYDDRLHFWVSEPDHGHGDALNKGFAHTSGEIMAWINSDDKYLPWTFRVVSEIFALFPNVHWISGLNASWSEHGVLTHATRSPKNIYDFLLRDYGWITQESVFWRRELWDASGGYIDTNVKFMVDGELWCRFFLNAELYSVDCVLGGYRYHRDNRATLNRELCCREMDTVIDIMEGQCSSDVVAAYRRLNLCRPLKRIPWVRRLPSTRLGCRLIPAFETARYKNIAYEDGGWVERTLSFWGVEP